MLTGIAILERELGAIDYAEHRLRRLLAGRPPKADGARLRADIQALRRRRAETLQALDDLNEQYDGRVARGVEAVRARASRSPRSRRETPEEARRRLGI